MGEVEYQDALKLGKKEYKACVSRGRFPYLPVLDDILSGEEFLHGAEHGTAPDPS